LTGTPVLTDMKPSTEKMTKPPNTLVAQLINVTINESLYKHHTNASVKIAFHDTDTDTARILADTSDTRD